MPRLPENSDRVKINFKSKIQDNAVVIPTVDGAKGKLNAKERKAYLERIIEDFDNKSETNTTPDNDTKLRMTVVSSESERRPDETRFGGC